MSRPWRVPAAAGAIVLIALVGAGPRRLTFAPIRHIHVDRGQPDRCAVVGYSAAGGASLRASAMHVEHEGFHEFLDDSCAPCRDGSGGLSSGGQVLSWARDAYCASPASFGTNGHVIFFGGANDDFLWGLASVARMFIVADQGVEPWRGNQKPAAAASLARIDQQTAALQGLMQCVHARNASFLFLHDFLVTDLIAGRDPDRATMAARRRATVEAAGGRFVDLFEAFASEAGVSWFNDYVHPSLVGHHRIADFACRLLQ